VYDCKARAGAGYGTCNSLYCLHVVSDSLYTLKKDMLNVNQAKSAYCNASIGSINSTYHSMVKKKALKTVSKTTGRDVIGV
jgi:hypothetical protein